MILDRKVLSVKLGLSEDYVVYSNLVDKMLKERIDNLEQFNNHRESLDMSYFRKMARYNLEKDMEYVKECEGMSVDQIARRLKYSIEYKWVCDRHERIKHPNGRDVSRALTKIKREIYILEYLQGLTVGCMDPLYGERERPKKDEILGIFEREFGLPQWMELREFDLDERSEQIKVVLNFLTRVFDDMGIEAFPVILGNTDLYWPEGEFEYDFDAHWSDERLARRVSNMGIFCYNT